MAVAHKVLDLLFRTLDAVDGVRERLDRRFGRGLAAEDWARDWRPGGEAPPAQRDPTGDAHQDRPLDPELRPTRSGADTRSARPGRRPAPRQASEVKAKPKGDGRKGSVDRSGKDLASPRAEAIVSHLKTGAGQVIADDADLSGKKVLARVLWALWAAEASGERDGLTAADTSALLHRAAGVEVFATNVARTCRDEVSLIEASVPDGRIKRYKLNQAGRLRARSLATRPFG